MKKYPSLSHEIDADDVGLHQEHNQRLAKLEQLEPVVVFCSRELVVLQNGRHVVRRGGKRRTARLALCRIKNFSTKRSSGTSKPTDHPVAALDISSETIQQGQFIAIAGFPLGSWNPTVQLGTIAATETVNPNVQGVPAGRRGFDTNQCIGQYGEQRRPCSQLPNRQSRWCCRPSDLFAAVVCTTSSRNAELRHHACGSSVLDSRVADTQPYCQHRAQIQTETHFEE